MLRVLTELDPYGLEPGSADGPPANEYDIETRPMAALLRADGAIRADQIDAIWSRWFSEPLTDLIGRERLSRLVVQLNDLTP